MGVGPNLGCSGGCANAAIPEQGRAREGGFSEGGEGSSVCVWREAEAVTLQSDSEKLCQC